MKQYLDLLRKVHDHGDDRMDRTGVGTRALFCETLEFDMADGFPAMTTKKLAFKQVVGELVGFIQGYTNNEHFEELGCNVWRQNAEADYWKENKNHSGEDGDLGRIYGAQWREWVGPDGKRIDQLQDVIDRIRKDPTDRRMIVSAWNPGELDRMALPPCHMSFQFFVRKGKYLDLMMLQRSCDLFLGVPFNIASYALLLHMVAQVTGLQPGKFKHVLNDVHIYKNHFDQVFTQLEREPMPLAGLELRPEIDDINRFMPEDVKLINYNHMPPIKAKMAV